MTTSTLTVRVRPRAGQLAIRGLRPDGALDVWVRAAPEGGKANAELLALLARELGVDRALIELVGGAKGRKKVVRIHELSPDELAVRVSRLASAGGGR